MRHRAAVVSAAFALASCGDPTGPSVPEHTLAFEYSGDVTGSYSASGLPTVAAAGVLAPTGYAAAMSYPQGTTRAGTLSFITQDPRGQQQGDMFLMSRIPTKRGTIAVASGSSDAPAALLYLGVLWTFATFQPTTIYVLDAGTLTITSVSATRVRGTFHGTAHLLRSSGTDPTRALTITNGEFDVPIDDPAVLSFRCGIFVC